MLIKQRHWYLYEFTWKRKWRIVVPWYSAYFGVNWKSALYYQNLPYIEVYSNYFGKCLKKEKNEIIKYQLKVNNYVNTPQEMCNSRYLTPKKEMKRESFFGFQSFWIPFFLILKSVLYRGFFKGIIERLCAIKPALYRNLRYRLTLYWGKFYWKIKFGYLVIWVKLLYMEICLIKSYAIARDYCIYKYIIWGIFQVVSYQLSR